MIPLENKCKPRDVLSLITKPSSLKIIARIHEARLDHRVAEVIGEDQCSFRKGKEIRDAKDNFRKSFCGQRRSVFALLAGGEHLTG